MSRRSMKHARKVSLDATINQALAKTVDARKVTALTVGAAGVIVGASLAFGTAPAMAAETNALDSHSSAEKQQSAEDIYDFDVDAIGNQSDTDATDNQSGKESQDLDLFNDDLDLSDLNLTEDEDNAQNASQSTASDETKSNEEKQSIKEDRAGEEKKPNEVDFSKSMPNIYGWATPNNTFDTDLAKQEVVYHLPKPEDGKKIVRVVILPDSRDGINTDEEAAYKNLIEYDSERVDDMHQTYSGIYEFKKNPDGSADLIMKQPFRDAGIKTGQGYCANRSIFLYYNEGDLQHNATSNNFRTATLVPPKVAKSIVLKYNERLSADTVRKMLHEAVNLPTDHKAGNDVDNMSVADQLVSQSKSGGVGLRVDENTVNNTPDTVDAKIPESMGAYDDDMFSKINTKNGDDYALGSNTLNTYMVTDLGIKSPAIPLTVVRYDDRIEKLEVENPNNLTADDRNAIAKRVAEKNHIDASKVSVDNEGNATINFDNLFQQNPPVISKDTLVMKKRLHLQDGDIELPSGENAVPVYNPIAYSKDDVARIKQAIFDANKNNSKLGLTSVDQITLEYLKGNLTKTGKSNEGISNGQSENTITVKINTDKAVGSFKSDIRNSKITRSVDLRKDYDVKFDKTKLDGRDSDEGLEWSEDHKTLIYRYDSSLGSEFNTNDLIRMLKATPKGDLASKGLRNLDGSDRFNFSREGTGGKRAYSHVNFFMDENGEPTGVLDILSQTPKGLNEPGLAVANSGEKMSESESKAGKYSFDKDSESVTVAAKEGKVYKARLFVDPYHPYYYMYVYDKGKNVYNTSKAINILFVPQTKNKKQDLIASVDKNKTLPDGTPTDPTYYNATPELQKAYDDALEEARKVSEEAKTKSGEDIKKNPELQAKIDNVTLKLDKARKDLDGDPTDKNPLQESVKEHGDDANSGTQSTDKYKNLDGDSFKTPDGKPDNDKNAKAKEAKKAYDDALAEAQKLVANPNATQKQVDAARDTLDKARKALDEFATDKDKLNESVNTNSGIDTGSEENGIADADPRYQNATDDERKAYDDAVKKAAELAKDPNATQTDSDTAADKLKEAKEALDKRETNKKLLDAQVQQSHDNDKADDLESASVFYRNAKKLKDGESLNGVDKDTALGYADAYDKALENANNVLKDPKATQKQVDEALEKLKKAEDDLHKLSSDPTDITKTVADNFAGNKLPAYFNAKDKANAGDKDAAQAFKDYNEAYEKAKAIKNKLADDPHANIDTREIEAAKKALDKAREVIEKYNTDATKLKASVDDDKATQDDPAYANVSDENASDEAKQAKKAYDDALEEAKKVLGNKLDKDVDENGNVIPNDKKNTDKNVDDKDFLDGVQKHADGRALQSDVDKALENLDKARKELQKYATKTDALKKSIDTDSDTKKDPSYKNASDTGYKNDETKVTDNAETPAKKAYDEALEEAKKVANDPKATQKQVDEVKKKLDEARKKIQDEYKTDITKLDDSTKIDSTKDPAYKNAADPNASEDAQKAKHEYDKALAKARELIAKHNGKDVPLSEKPTQAQIDDALKKLQKAREDLQKYATRTKELRDEAGKDGDFTKTTEFQNAVDRAGDNENPDVAEYKKALDEANRLLNDPNATQKQVDEALRKLKYAKDLIADKYKTVLDDLQRAYDKDEPFSKTLEYTNALNAGDNNGNNPDVAAYKKALDEAKRVLNDPNATQKQVDDALSKLRETRDLIAKKYKTNKEELQKEYDKDGSFTASPEFNGALVSIGLDGEENPDLAAYKSALTEAKRVLNDPKATQKQVDDALRKLKEARQRIIDNYNSGDDFDFDDLGDLGDFGDDSDANENGDGNYNGGGNYSGGGYSGVYNNGSANGFGTSTVGRVETVDKSALKVEVDNSVSTIGNGENAYTHSYVTVANTPEAKNYQNALDHAKQVLSDPNATQAQVDEALNALRNAKDALSKRLAGNEGKSNGGKIADTGANISAFAGLAATLAGLGIAGFVARRRKNRK